MYVHVHVQAWACVCVFVPIIQLFIDFSSTEPAVAKLLNSFSFDDS